MDWHRRLNNETNEYDLDQIGKSEGFSKINAFGNSSLLVIFFVGVFLFTPSLMALSKSFKGTNGQRIQINSLNLDSDMDTGITKLSGKVQVLFENELIQCDQATINEKKHTIEARGNLVITSPLTYVEGDHALLNYESNTGVIANGFIKSGQVVFEGQLIKKTGPQTYLAESARYTACDTCPPAWSFSGSSMKAELGGYAHIKNSILEVAHVPVFWLPYLIVPLKSERQTGLLIPSIEFEGDRGNAITMSYFWAISRSQDATLSVKNYSERGLKGLLNYRYLLNDSSGGNFDFGIIRDRLYATEEEKQNPQQSFSQTRWFINYDHRYELPNEFVQKTNLAMVSDLRYSRDFAEELPGQGAPALDNRVSLTRNSDSIHTSLDTSYYINQLKRDSQSDNRDAVHRWPEIKFSLAETNLGDSGLLFNFTGDYVNFVREDLAYDDVVVSDIGERSVDVSRKIISTTDTPSTGGVFDPEVDLIRTGQRLDLKPEISYPIRLGSLLDILPSAQFRHIQYSFNVDANDGTAFDSSPFRQFVQGRVSTRTRFYRIFQLDSSRGEHPMLIRHELEPEIILAGIPYIKDSDSPFFGQNAQVPSFIEDQPVSDADFQSQSRLQFDYNDRIINRNTASFVLSNRFIRKKWKYGQPEYKQIATVKLSQTYDFDEARATGRPTFPWSDISGAIDVRLDHFETNTLIRYFPYHNVTNSSSRWKIMTDRGAYFEMGFNQTFLITQRVEEAYSGRSETISFSAGFNSRYLDFSGGMATIPEQLSPLQLKVTSWSTNMNIKPPGNCWGIRVSINQIVGSPSPLVKFNFDFKFGG